MKAILICISENIQSSNQENLSFTTAEDQQYLGALQNWKAIACPNYLNSVQNLSVRTSLNKWLNPRTTPVRDTLSAVLSFPTPTVFI